MRMCRAAPGLDLPMIDRPSAAPARLVWSVAALVQAVADALAARFSPCVVRGEVSGFSRAASGHCYFSLKDASGGAALLRCAMFRRAAALLDFVPQDGQLVGLRGRLGVYEPRGELQLVVESMQRAGAGALFEQFLKLKARLEAEGLFDAALKRPVPAWPRRLGVITSLGAAALRDVVTTLARRSPHVQVLVYPSVVQGAEAPAALCAALDLAVRRNEVDCLILCRGGGSLEDLWAFNDERVVRAIRAMPMPLICGVGHETDVTLADFAADLRAATPTAAAELAAPDARACLGALQLVAETLQRRVRELLDGRAQRLDTLSLRLTRPAEAMRRRAQRLDLLAHRLVAATQRSVARHRTHGAHLQERLIRATAVLESMQGQRLAALDARLRALDPQHVLARGYAWLSDTSGRPVLGVADLAVGAPLQARLADGTARVVVTGVESMPER
jgi:exodeoxyribonuclease VII large subunit